MNSILRYDSDLSQRLSLDLTTYPDSNNNSEKMSVGSRGDKYSLRPRSIRRSGSDEDEIKPVPTTKSRVSKPKQKPAPLSKYRRKTANARERSRMREINAAFETLRRAVPHLQCANVSAATASANEKLTKITTLRLAMKYISALSSVLKDSTSNMLPSSGANSSVDFGDLLSDCNDLDCLFFESDGESLQLHSDLSDHSLPSVDFRADFTDNSSTSYNFGDHSFTSTFNDHSQSPFDSLFSEFS